MDDMNIVLVVLRARRQTASRTLQVCESARPAAAGHVVFNLALKLNMLHYL